MAIHWSAIDSTGGAMPGDVRAVPTGFRAAVRSVGRRAIATRARLVIIAVTVFLGLAVPVLMAVAGDPADRTFAAVGSATLSLMTIPLPFLGALVAIDLYRDGNPVQAFPMLVAAALLAVVAGAFGGVMSAIAVAVSSDGAAGAWSGAWMVMALLWAGGLNALGTAVLRRRLIGVVGQPSA